jgi:DivIVA domain-containing protein
MMWFFAVLVVLVMGGVAALAAGRGAPMAEAYDDRPDALVPKGPLDAEDVRKVRFSLAFRGYRMSEVDALLDRLARQLERVQAPPSEAAADPDVAGQGEVAEPPAVREARGDDPLT